MKTYLLRKHLIRERLKGKMVLFDSSQSALYTLNETASFILKHMLLGKSVTDTARALAKTYGKKPENIEQDVRECLSRLLKERILVPQKKKPIKK